MSHRLPYYALDEDGYLLATVYLTLDEALKYEEYIAFDPPPRLPKHRLRFIEGEWIQEEVEEPPPVPRFVLEKQWLDRVDTFVGEERARHITAIPGQAETYIDKAADADAYLADPDPDPEAYPWVHAEARATGVTLLAAAQAIVAQRDAWRWLGVYIEEARIYAKAQIRAAETEEAMQLIYDELTAKLGNIQ